jgi:hypothetical protein
MGGFLVAKLVKPIKTVCSWTPYQRGANQVLLPETESYIRAAAAGVLGKADAAVRQELCRLDSPDRVLYQATEFLALLVGDGGLQVLNLYQMLADEDDLGDFGDARHPGVANQLGIQREQSVRLFRITAGRGFPLQ